MAIATWQDVQTRLRRALKGPEGASPPAPGSSPGMTDEKSFCMAIIGDFQSELETMLGRPLEQRTITESRWLDLATWDLALSATPIASVTSLSIDGVMIDPSAFSYEPGGILAFSQLDFGPGGVPLVTDYTTLGTKKVDVVYVAGISDPAKARPAKSAVVARACRVLNMTNDDALGTKALNVEGYGVTWVDDGFTEAEMKAVRRLRRRVAV